MEVIFRSCFFYIDKVVFNLISQIYDLLMIIARTSPLSQTDIAIIADRIYGFLTIFMIFKVTFSLIMYVVNPDDFTEKSKGISKLTVNIIISLALLILTPYIFNMAYELQTIILEDNALATLVFGNEQSNSEEKKFLTSAGDTLAYIAASPFITPNTSIDTLQSCVSLLERQNNSNELLFNPECSGLDNESLEPIGDIGLSYLAATEVHNDSFEKKTIQNYVAGVNNQNLGLFLREDLIKARTNEKTFLMDYRFIFSTAVGVVLVLLLITYCMDIAVRSIKLAFLQLIAPIPIISYVDPKSGKDGLFKKWYKMCFSTYISLFVRLLVIYFAIYIISKVADMKLIDVIDGSYVTGGFLQIFIVLGTLMFAKQLPKMLEGLGIKLDGDGKFTLNPLKKIEEGAIGGKRIAKTAKGLGVAAGGAALVGGASLLTGKGFRATGSAIGKAISGGLKGEKFGKNFSSSYAAGMQKKKELAKMDYDGVSPTEVALENFKNKFRGATAKDELDDFNASIKEIKDGYTSYYNGVLGSDKIAKEFERYRKAAENSGDQDGMRMWQDAIDKRVKQIQNNGGKIALTASSSDITTALASARSTDGYDVNLAPFSAETVDKGLVSIKSNVEKAVTHINSNYDGKFDYSRGDISSTGDLKTINGQTSSADRAAQASEDVRHINNLYKYVKDKSKK